MKSTTALRARRVAAIMAIGLAAALATAVNAQQCGSQAGGSTDHPYCGAGSQSRCNGCGTGDQGLSSILSRDLFERLLLHRNDGACLARGFYTYDAFLAAAAAYPSFGTTRSTETRKREVAAFLGQTSHETTGGWATAPDGPYSWGYCFKQEKGNDTPKSYCESKLEWPARYRGGPAQQPGPSGDKPNGVVQDRVVVLDDGTSKQAGVARCDHGSVDAAGRTPGYGVIVSIINGEIECGKGQSPEVVDRIGFYKRYCDVLGVGYGSNLDCYNQRSFKNGLLAGLASQ
ncbi:hypothetical protein CFC21_112119 [Triticum aestivum]|uniref:chitinase n=2 Tax=Triticum aestivum TaxID=4565 RepID=A0A9R0G448_WHEAT|nr:hypothetical protein [Triticum aestivum]